MSQHLTISIVGGRYNVSVNFWNHLESAIASLSGHDAGRLTRIARPDGRCDYRSDGEYDLVFTPESGDDVVVSLILM